MSSEKLDFFETQFDQFGEIVYVNETDIPDIAVANEVQKDYPEIARAINQWNHRAASRGGSVFHQDRYVAPTNFFDELRTASYAAKYDDIVSNAVDTTEQLAFKRVKVEVADARQNDVWRQIADEIDLEQRLREIWREVFIYSQCYVAVKWHRRNYRPYVKMESKQSRSNFNLSVPKGISILDPLKVVPVGTFMFGQERLAFIADPAQIADFDERIADMNSSDQTFNDLIVDKYQPSPSEAELLSDLTGMSDIDRRLYLLNDENVFRVTSTRPSYQRTADVRMASIFELLDLKHLLREVDRTELLSSTNAIILVKKGSDELPATSAELSNVHSKMTNSARIPLIISDHRIEIEIITRKNDKTLATEKYNGLDSRITSRLYQVLSSGNYCVTPDTEVFTKTGWKTYDNLEVGELVYSANPDTFKGEWTPVEAVNVFDYEGPMLSMESRAHSSMSTPNHRWIVESKRGKAKVSDVRWKRSDELNLSDRIPVSSVLEAFPVEAKYTDELVELAAWFWCEGHRQVDAPNRIEIAQSAIANPDKCERIERALTKVFGPRGKVADGGVWYQTSDKEQYFVSATVTKPLLDLFEDNQPWGTKTEPKYPKLDFIHSLTKDQMELFVDICVQGDGHLEDNGRRRWHQQDLKSVEIFEMCLIMLGIPNRYRLDHSREEAGVWTVEFLKRDFANPMMSAYSANGRGSRDAASVEWVPYSGTVWCPTTGTGTWLARRNGKTFITGNSSGTAVDDSPKLFRVISATMEARRDNIRDAVMNHIVNPTWERNKRLEDKPEMKFYPRRIALDFDNNIATYIQDLKDRNIISAETQLAELDIEIDNEMEKIRREQEEYGDVLEQFQVPYSAPSVQDNPKAIGRAGGGNKNGGGANRDSFTANPNGRGPTDKESAEEEVDEDSE